MGIPVKHACVRLWQLRLDTMAMETQMNVTPGSWESGVEPANMSNTAGGPFWLGIMPPGSSVVTAR